MKEEKNQWMESVFRSMKGSQKAKPSSDLFAKIELSIANSHDMVIPMRRFRLLAAAASLILIVNASAILLYLNHNLNDGDQASVESKKMNKTYRESLLSTFQIY